MALPPVLTTAAELQALTEALHSQTLVAFDTEFHSERTYVPRLMLVQVATREGVYLVDPLALDARPLFEALAQPGKVVVGHALKNDLRIAWLQFGVTFEQVFDTQIAAAFLGHGLQIGLGTLLQSALRVHQPKGEQMSDWSQRPLPERMLGYAVGDVAHLLKLYDLLHAELHHLGRVEWVREECQELTDPARYARDPEAAWRKVAGGRRMDPKEAGVLHALAAEREVIAMEEDVVPHFLVPDDVLLLLTRVQPRSRRDLDGDRRMQQRAVQRYAQRWIDAVHRGLRTPIQRPAGRPPPGAELEAVASLMMLLVGDIAARSSLAPQLLIKRDTLLHALRESPTKPEELAEAAELRGWRAEILVEPLWDLLVGRTRVRCQPGGPGGVRVAFDGQQ